MAMGLGPHSSLDAARRAVADRLDAGGVASAALEARLLIAHVTGLSHASLIARGNEPLGAAAATLEALTERRLRGEPLARLFGAWEFYGLPFDVSPATLIPRADTELLVDTALAWLGDRPALIADIGTGSGAILVALLCNAPRVVGVGLDLSVDALTAARANATRAGVAARAHFAAGDLAAALPLGMFDAIVSNPPYIASAVIETLAPEVRFHDPRLALDGGADGLDCYKRLIPQMFLALKEGGWGALEIGYDQRVAVEALMRAAGFEAIETRRDLGDRDRVVIGCKPRAVEGDGRGVAET